MKIEFYRKSEHPDEINIAQSRFSVDVLVYFPCLDEHTIGWYDYIGNKWLFLSNQDYTDRPFVWRYLTNELDRRLIKKGRIKKKNKSAD